jgi:hypothetical protein
VEYQIAYNEFKTSGNIAFFLDSYCTTSRYCTKVSDGGEQECPSIGNKFRYNDLYTGYQGRFLKAFKLDKGEDYEKGYWDCGIEQIDRLSTYKNIRH